MTDDAKKGGAGSSHQGGPRAEVSDALLELFKELVNKTGQQAPSSVAQGRPLSAEANAVVARFAEIQDALAMVPAINELKKDEHKSRQQKGG